MGEGWPVAPLASMGSLWVPVLLLLFCFRIGVANSTAGKEVELCGLGAGRGGGGGRWVLEWCSLVV